MVIDSLSPTRVQQNERLRALYHLAVELSALQSLDNVLNVALQHCLALTESQFGFIGLTKDEDRESMDVVAIQGFFPSPQFYKENHLIPLRPNLFARAVLENRSVRTSDAMRDPQRVGQPRGHPPVNAFLGVPLRIQDQPIGMIGVANRPQPYDDEHEQLLMTYAAQVAIVIRNAQLYEELTAAKSQLERKVANRTRQLEEAKEALAQKAAQLQKLLVETVDVQERERQRIAHDMHDGVNQLLIGAMLELKSAQQRLANGDIDRAGRSISAVRTILQRIEAEMKQVVYDLRPPTLDALGLAPAMRRYAERFEQYSGVPCAVTVYGDPVRLASRTEIGVYRLMQEALQNISAHAAASQAQVILSFSPHALKLTISDDGCGFDLEAVRQNNQGHFGILGMSERAESLGGYLNICTRSEEGTQVELVVPVDDGP